MQAIAGPELAFDLPLFPSHSSHLCCYERSGWGRQNWVCPRAWETLGTPLGVGKGMCHQNINLWHSCKLELNSIANVLIMAGIRFDTGFWFLDLDRIWILLKFSGPDYQT